MKQIKKFYKEHRVFTILMSVVLVCLILIVTVLIQVFNHGNEDERTKEGYVEISKSKEEDFEKNIVSTGKVKKCDLTQSNKSKTIFITMQFEESIDLEEAKNIALKSLESFTEEELTNNDIQFTLKKNTSEKIEGFLIEGSHNKNGTGLHWVLNREVSEEVANDNSTEKDE